MRALLWLTDDLVGVDSLRDRLPATVFQHIKLDAKGILPEQVYEVEPAPHLFHDSRRTLHGISFVSVEIESFDANTDGNEAETGFGERNVKRRGKQRRRLSHPLSS